jgi:hypothetical protein
MAGVGKSRDLTTLIKALNLGPLLRCCGSAQSCGLGRLERGGVRCGGRQKFAAEFKAQTGLPFPVLTDIDNGYAMSLNLAIWVGPDLERLLQSYGHSLPNYQGNETWILPIPATLVVGSDGIVSARFVDPDFRRRLATDELLEALRLAA